MTSISTPHVHHALESRDGDDRRHSFEQRAPLAEAARLARELSTRSHEASSATHYEELTRRVKELGGLFRYGLYSAFGELGLRDIPAVERPVPEHGSAVFNAAISSDGRIVALSGPTTAAAAISIEDKREVISVGGALEDACKRVHLRGASDLFHVSAAQSSPRVVRTDLGGKSWLGRFKSSTVYEASSQISDFDLSSGGMMAVAGSDLCVRLLDISGGRARAVAALECRDYPEHVAISGSGDVAIVAEAGFSWEARGRVVVAALDRDGGTLGEIASKEISGRVTSIALSANGELAAAGTEAGELSIVSTRQASPFDRPVFEKEMPGPISAIDFNPGANLVAVAAGSRLSVWSLEESGDDGNPLEVASFRATSPISTASFKPDGSGLVIGESSGKIWIF